MALTKINFYISTLLIVSLLMGGLITTGTALLNKDRITLSPDSESYINTITQQSINGSIDDIYDSDSNLTKSQSLVGESEEGGIPIVSDVLAVLNFFRNIGSKIGNFFKIVYNVPTIILISLGFGSKILEFAYITNTITYILFFALLITIIKNLLK